MSKPTCSWCEDKPPRMLCEICGPELRRAVSDLWREVASVAPLALWLTFSDQVPPVGMNVPERRSYECSPGEAYPEVLYAIARCDEAAR